jgi:hypothetical protein
MKKQYSPPTNAEIVCIIFAGNKTATDKVAVADKGGTALSHMCTPTTLT